MQTRRRKQRGAGYQTSQQFFNPSVLPPATGLLSAAAPSSAPTSNWVRPPMMSTFQTGGSQSRKMRGGFSPSVMGGFIPNAQAAIVPAALYAAYHTLVRKRGAAGLTKRVKKLYKSLTSRRSRRGNRV